MNFSFRIPTAVGQASIQGAFVETLIRIGHRLRTKILASTSCRAARRVGTSEDGLIKAFAQGSWIARGNNQPASEQLSRTSRCAGMSERMTGKLAASASSTALGMPSAWDADTNRSAARR